jgi:hypothetical protein
MLAVVATTNLFNGASLAQYGDTPTIGVSDYDNTLANIGSGAFTVLLALNQGYGNTSNTPNSLGQPIFNFTELYTSGTYLHQPNNGISILNCGTTGPPIPSLKLYQNFDYNNYAGQNSSGSYISWTQIDTTGAGFANRFGMWNFFGWVKAGGGTGVIQSGNGGTLGQGSGSYNYLTTVGTPTVPAWNAGAGGLPCFYPKVRFFHSIEAQYGLVNCTMQGAAGVWIISGALTQTALNAATANAAGMAAAVAGAENATPTTLITRSYAGQNATAYQALNAGIPGTTVLIPL